MRISFCKARRRQCGTGMRLFSIFEKKNVLAQFLVILKLHIALQYMHTRFQTDLLRFYVNSVLPGTDLTFEEK